jgi:hypothetical protein
VVAAVVEEPFAAVAKSTSGVEEVARQKSWTAQETQEPQAFPVDPQVDEIAVPADKQQADEIEGMTYRVLLAIAHSIGIESSRWWSRRSLRL